MTRSSLPSYQEVEILFANEDACLAFLQEHGCFDMVRTCSACGTQMTLRATRLSFRCGRKSCRREEALRNGSFFQASKLPVSKIMQLAYFWLQKISVQAQISMTGLSGDTVCDFNVYFRQLVASALEINDCVIGGENIIVEIDESKFGKRKYHRGHAVEGTWVLGGVERTPERKMFIVEVPDRSAETLISVIREYVRPNSIIFTDMWRGYASLADELSVTHQTVNHSLHFMDPITGVHTNTIEGTWCGLKRRVPIRNRVKGSVNQFADEAIWRRKHERDLWNGFLLALQTVGYQ